MAAGLWQRLRDVLALAAADSFSRLRNLSGRIVVVCCATALRKYRWICRTHLLLFLAFTDSGERRLACRTGDRRGPGGRRGFFFFGSWFGWWGWFLFSFFFFFVLRVGGGTGGRFFWGGGWGGVS